VDVDWTKLTLKKVQWKALLNGEINFSVPNVLKNLLVFGGISDSQG
jgi:hypothetical protein